MGGFPALEYKANDQQWQNALPLQKRSFGQIFFAPEINAHHAIYNLLSQLLLDFDAQDFRLNIIKNYIEMMTPTGSFQFRLSFIDQEQKIEVYTSPTYTKNL